MNGEMMFKVIVAAILVLIIRDEWRKIRAWWQIEQKWKRKWQ